MSKQQQSYSSRGQSTNQSQQSGMTELLTYPMTQLMDLQKTAAKLTLNGLEMTSWAQSRNLDLTKETLDSFIQTMERTSRETEQLGQQGMQQARSQLSEFGQGFQSGSQVAGQQYQQPQTRRYGQSQQSGQKHQQPQQFGQEYQQPQQTQQYQQQPQQSQQYQPQKHQQSQNYQPQSQQAGVQQPRTESSPVEETTTGMEGVSQHSASETTQESATQPPTQ